MELTELANSVDPDESDDDETQTRHVCKKVKPDTHSSGPDTDLEYEALADPVYLNCSTNHLYESLYVPLGVTEPQLNATEDVQLPVQDNFRAVVAAIDFGTTYSGWSYALRDDFLSDPSKVTIKNWSSGSITSCKTPTCILISPDGVSVEAFGYDAETKYAELVKSGRHKDYYFFSRFKMELHKSIQQGVERNFELTSATGSCLKANDVFALSIKWLKEDLLSEWADRLPGAINEADVHWMLTVPAIWSDAAKQFMHEAAMKAGIVAEKLSIVLEPEVASIVCRYTTPPEASNMQFKDGLQYLILDAGGGTIDVTVHEIVGKNYLKEVALASGGRWGGITVDTAFEELVKDMVGAEVYDEFKGIKRDDYIDLMRHFEIKKRLTSEETERDVIFSLPLSLLDIYQRQTGVELVTNDIKEGITVKRNKIYIKKSEFKKLFTETCGHIVDHLRKIIGRDEVGNISVILMVGGFSESLVLQDAVKQSFPGIKVIVPRDASLCVLKGAVMYGHFSNVITERVIRYTYGTNVYKRFEENIHPPSKLIETERGIFCKDIFSKYVQAGQVVKVGEPQMQKLYHPAKAAQKKMFLAIYASELPNPEFVTDHGCTRIGTITVDMPDTKEDLKREVLVTFSFSGTELIVTAKDTASGTVSNVILDLLS